MNLDEAFAATFAQRKSVAPKSKRTPEAPQETSTLFTSESNWLRGKTIALIHDESDTLLGCFVEFTHRSVKGARKLIREDTLSICSSAERVEGSWWLGDGRRPEPRQEWHTQRPAIVHLHLDKLGVHSPAVEVLVHLSYNGIARCELGLDTQFAGEDENMLFLPKGTNVLEVCSLDTKISLRKACGL